MEKNIPIEKVDAASPHAVMLQATGIQKHFGQLHVLKGVNLTVGRGEIVALVGASGAGKSTLLQILGTLDDPDQGEIWFDNEAVHLMRDARKSTFRNEKLGFVFQFHHLLPEFNALENIALPSLIGGMDRNAANKRAAELLAYMGLSDRATHKPSQLSGGEQQRVAVARALMNKPQLILADEPTGNLDSINSERMYELFVQLAREFQVGFLITTHNERLAAGADRCLAMKDGFIV
ncbi:MAG TPA: ABC transporter ATP-binding protein [Bacteroidia bacterium]|nr:ABC transporter ATP-binding protein [Bacteroidia bacterium]